MMLIMIPNIRITAARLAALLLLTALLCAGVHAAVAKENTMTMAVGTANGDAIRDIGTDPTIAFNKDQASGLVGRQYYHVYTHFSPLITQDSDANIVPYLAESYEVSDDYKTITFHIRKGVKFADGTPLNASILKFNFDRLLNFGYNESYQKSKFTPAMYYDYSEAPDESTFVIHFTQGWSEMPFDLSRHQFGYFISPLDVDPAWDIKGVLKSDKKYNGLGPYYVNENESISKEKVVLQRRDSWRNDLDFDKPKLDKIIIVLIQDPQTAVMALEKGEVDYICRYWNAPLDSLLKLKEDPKISIETYPESHMYFIRTAYWKEPFNGSEGIAFRKALCCALNRTEMVEGAFYGYALPATDSMGLSPRLRSDVPQCCQKGYDFNLDEAKQLLSEAGWNDTDGDGILDKDGKDLRSLDFVITSSTDLVWQKDLALIVQSQLRKIGIDVKIRSLESAAYYDLQKSGDFDMLMTYNMGRGFPASQELKWFNYKKLYGKLDYYSDQNGTLEVAVTNSQGAVSKEERDRYLCQASDILFEEAGVIPLVYEMEYAVMSSDVKGFKFGPSMSSYYLDHVEDCWIED
jgi:ABC-type transport system substrate-binding protein